MVEQCDRCGGAGEFSVIMRDPDDRPEIRRYGLCMHCNGRGWTASECHALPARGAEICADVAPAEIFHKLPTNKGG